MRHFAGAIAALILAALPAASHAQSGGVERLYILNCGEGRAGDISRWSPCVNEGQSMDFVDNCYLIKHAQGWMLWDTGIADAVASMPNGLPPADPKAVTWHRPKTLIAQLEQLGVNTGGHGWTFSGFDFANAEKNAAYRAQWLLRFSEQAAKLALQKLKRAFPLVKEIQDLTVDELLKDVGKPKYVIKFTAEDIRVGFGPGVP